MPCSTYPTQLPPPNSGPTPVFRLWPIGRKPSLWTLCMVGKKVSETLVNQPSPMTPSPSITTYTRCLLSPLQKSCAVNGSPRQSGYSHCSLGCSDVANIAALLSTKHLNLWQLKRKKNHFFIKTADFESNIIEMEDWLEQY